MIYYSEQLFSPYSLLNYMKQKGKLYSFYIREDFFLMRKEYNQYCQWACSKLSNLRWNTRVDYVSYDEALQCYRVRAVDTVSGQQQDWLTRRLVLGTGPEAWLPAAIHSGRVLRTPVSIWRIRRICRKNRPLPSWVAGRARQRSITICLRRSIGLAIS